MIQLNGEVYVWLVYFGASTEVWKDRSTTFHLPLVFFGDFTIFGDVTKIYQVSVLG